MDTCRTENMSTIQGVTVESTLSRHVIKHNLPTFSVVLQKLSQKRKSGAEKRSLLKHCHCTLKKTEKARGIVTAACKSLECFSAQVVSTWQRQLCGETLAPRIRDTGEHNLLCMRKRPGQVAAARLHLPGTSHRMSRVNERSSVARGEVQLFPVRRHD